MKTSECQIGNYLTEMSTLYESCSTCLISGSLSLKRVEISENGPCSKHYTIYPLSFIKEPVSSEKYKLACAPIEDSDQPARPRSLIRFFDERSMGSQGSSLSSGEKLRIWSYYADTHNAISHQGLGSQWISGRVLDCLEQGVAGSRPNVYLFCVLEQDTLSSA